MAASPSPAPAGTSNHLLPGRSGAYRQLMQPLLADDLTLCAQLRAGKLATRWEAPRLLATYAANRREALLHARR